MSAAENKAVFLSYASQDAEAAQRVCDALRTAGVEVWFDKNELVGGDAWDQKIRRQIKECALFVPVISANSNARLEGYFRREWKLAVDRSHDMAEEKAFLVPVVVDETTEARATVPDRFRDVQWTRLHGGETTPAFCARVKDLLAPAAAPSGEPPRAVAAAPALPARRRPATRATAVWVAGALCVLSAVAAVIVTARRDATAQARRARTLAEIDRRIAARDVLGAFAVAEQQEHDSPGDPNLAPRWDKIAVSCAIETTPSGAEIWMKPYAQPQTAWRRVGTTPLHDVRLPRIYARWRIEKPGCAPREIAANTQAVMTLALDPADFVPPGMVHVSAGSTPTNSTGLPSLRLPAFLIDRCEVTNRQFKEFVDAGGYAKPEFWREPFVKGGRILAREEVMAAFHDSTGRPGPANWRNGTYAEGAAELPVTGVSWFEAAAYAGWAGKRLPSIYHWRAAARVSDLESSVPLSNFGGKGLAPVGTYQGMSACGAYDMAGNAKEWCANAADPEVRYIFGGSWREPAYMFVQADALSPFDRSDGNGFRCVKLLGTEPLPPAVDAPHVPLTRDYSAEQPVSDEIFRVLRSIYSYDKAPLESRLEATDDSDPRWRKEKVSYRAAYGDERISAFLFLPKNATPPYQTITYFPGAGALSARTSDALHDLSIVSVLVASGRALIYPVYQGTYERHTVTVSEGTATREPAAYRDWLVMVAKDLGRTIDYLETRNDVQAGNLAYAGNSLGGAIGAILPAIERRIKVNVLVIGGFLPFRLPPEADQINFAPRNTVPTLMVSGRYDFRFPLETSQRPMFKWLGAPPERKRHVLFDTGHALKAEQIASVAYAWLDQYQGLVK